MRHCQWTDDTIVDAHELDQEPNRTSEHQVAAQDERIAPSLTSPAKKENRQRHQSSRFVELCRMYWNGGRRQSLRERNCPRQVGGSSVIVADQKATDSADGVPDGQGGCRRREHGHLGPPLPPHDGEPGEHATRKAAEPAHSASTQEKVEKPLLTEVFHDP